MVDAILSAASGSTLKTTELGYQTWMIHSAIFLLLSATKTLNPRIFKSRSDRYCVDGANVGPHNQDLSPSFGQGP
jgi:hypothetical protein